VLAGQLVINFCIAMTSLLIVIVVSIAAVKTSRGISL